MIHYDYMVTNFNAYEHCIETQQWSTKQLIYIRLSQKLTPYFRWLCIKTDKHNSFPIYIVYTYLGSGQCLKL